MLDGIKKDGELKPYTGLQMASEYTQHPPIVSYGISCSCSPALSITFGSSSKIVHWRGFHTGKLQDMYGHLYDKTWNDLP